jgi:hypothetical protein
VVPSLTPKPERASSTRIARQLATFLALGAEQTRLSAPLVAGKTFCTVLAAVLAVAGVLACRVAAPAGAMVSPAIVSAAPSAAPASTTDLRTVLRCCN